MKNLEAEESRLGKIIAATPAPQVVRLPANYDALYIRAIAELDVHLASEDGAAARNTIRPLVEKIVAQPSSAREGNRRPCRFMVTCTNCFRSLRLRMSRTRKVPV